MLWRASYKSFCSTRGSCLKADKLPQVMSLLVAFQLHCGWCRRWQILTRKINARNKKKKMISLLHQFWCFLFFTCPSYPTVLQTCNAELVEYSVKLLFNQYYLKKMGKIILQLWWRDPRYPNCFWIVIWDCANVSLTAEFENCSRWKVPQCCEDKLDAAWCLFEINIHS